MLTPKTELIAKDYSESAVPRLSCLNPLKSEAILKKYFNTSEDVEFLFSPCCYIPQFIEESENELNSDLKKPIVFIYWSKNAMIYPMADQLSKFVRPEYFLISEIISRLAAFLLIATLFSRTSMI